MNHAYQRVQADESAKARAGALVFGAAHGYESSMRTVLLTASFPLLALAQEPAKPAKTGWTLMVDAEGQGAAKVSHAAGLTGTYERARAGIEAVHVGEDHALDIEYYQLSHTFTGAIAADPDRTYGDSTTLRISAFKQWDGPSAHAHYQLVGGIESSPEDGLGLGEAFRWSAGGAYRWTPGAQFDVALGFQLTSRYEQSILPIPFVRAYWNPDPRVSVELRVTGLQNGFYARWFVTADKATSVDFACAYETQSILVADGTYGARGLGIGEVPLRLGVTQFLESSGTWFARVGFDWVAFHRETFSHDGETMGVFQAADVPRWSVRLGGRF
jgi:hypothetical protein